MIKSIIKFSIDRPILNHILFILIMVMALFSYRNIPKEIFPPSNLDKIVIRGSYVGTSADVLDKMVVKSLEDDLKSVENINNLQTTIQNGSFVIEADIKPSANKQMVLNDVKDVISKVKKDLPSDMNEPTARVLVHQFPLLLIAISADIPKYRLLEAAKSLKSRLSNIRALNSIDIRGDADSELHIGLNQKKLEAYGFSKEMFYKAISTLSSIYPAGTFKYRGDQIFISTQNGEKEAKKLMETLITLGDRRVRVGDVATVNFGLSTPKEISSFNGKKNISLNITKTEEGNAIALSHEVKEILKEFSKKHREITFKIYTNTSIWIKNRINLVSSNIFFGLILVFLALFLSVNWRIATVVAIGIPTSFFIALIGAELLGYSMNMLTMLGALIALGMLVDEAIVVAENIYRHMEMGKPPSKATIDGASEMFPAVMTATLTTVFAFLPLLIMSGELGIFMRVLPVMITILLLSSLFEAFYFLPLHSKEFFSIGGKIDRHELTPFWDRAVERYKKFLLSLQKQKEIALLIIVSAIVFGTYQLSIMSKFQLFPRFDASQIYISGKVDVNSKLNQTHTLMREIESKLLRDFNNSDVSSITSITGIRFFPDQTFENGEHLFHIFINLHERRAENFFDKYINPWLSLEYDDSDMIRVHSSQEILKDVQKSLKEFENNSTFQELTAFVPQTGIVGSDIEIDVVAQEQKRAMSAIENLKAQLNSIDGVDDVTDNAKKGPKELKLRVNGYGQRLGFSEAYIVNILRGLFLEAEYSKMFDSTGLIRVKIKEVERDKNIDISSIRVLTPDGKRMVKLKDVTEFIYKNSMLKIFKEDGKRVWSVTARVDRDKILPSEVMSQLQPFLEKERGEGVDFIVKGEEKENRQVKKEMAQAGVIAIFLIFVSLVWMFNSVILPLITVSVIPLSVFGALVGNFVMGIDLTVPGMMGIVGLSGVVVNDALIMLDFIRKAENREDLVERASIRLRPIFLTSLTTVLGLTSLIFFASGQSLIIQPMAIFFGFGIAWATILNLVYVPIIYSVIYRVKID